MDKESEETISFCVIAGLEEATIVRMLDSFRGCFDELCLVIAQGSKAEDQTLTLAQEWSKRNNVECQCSVYHNAIEAESWPHVDDFAAARNKAFNMASSDWILWADCDDVFVGKSSQIRSIAVEEADADVHHFGYDVANAGKLVSRERLIRRSTITAGASWHGAIHENFRARSNHTHKKHNLTLWRHAPIEDRPPSSDRNLRILSKELNDAPAYSFYVHQDFYLRGEHTKAKKWAEVFLAMPVSDASLRYQAHLNLSAMATEHRLAAQHALAAYWDFPFREALAALVNCAFQEHNATKALYFAKLLIDTPIPAEPVWCHEPRWYGWHGQDLYNRARRLAGECVTEYAGETIVLIHETDESDVSFVQDRDLWMTSATQPSAVFHLFSVPDDQFDSKWFASFAREKRSKISDWVGSRWDDVKKIKPGDVPTIGWDEQFENEKL